MILDYVSWAIGATGGVVGIWSAVARMRIDQNSESGRLWRENAEAEKARADRLETELADLANRVARLENENTLLRSLVTGETAIRELSATVAVHHAEVMAALAALRGPTRAVEQRKAPAVQPGPSEVPEGP